MMTQLMQKGDINTASEYHDKIVERWVDGDDVDRRAITHQKLAVCLLGGDHPLPRFLDMAAGHAFRAYDIKRSKETAALYWAISEANAAITEGNAGGVAAGVLKERYSDPIEYQEVRRLGIEKQKQLKLPSA